jgi:nucleotide-binding universal stress UspA family protein
MKKILVTTDFSPNSKAGLRFAIQLATQDKYNLTFFHSYEVKKPVGWSDKVFESFEKSDLARIEIKLRHFAESVYASLDIAPGDFECVAKSSYLTDTNIMQYAAQNGFSFICIGRRGRGRDRKLFGTNTFNLITKSAVPIIAVPDSYRPNKIKNILYASDLSNLEKEIKKVVEFSRPLGAEIELLHFKVPSDPSGDSLLIEKTIREFSDYNVNLHLENLDFTETLISNLDRIISKSKPSMMIMFTQQNKGFFEKLFASSTPARYSFQSKIPLLVFKKL